MNKTVLQAAISSDPELRFKPDETPVWSCKIAFPGREGLQEVGLVVSGKKASELSADSSLMKGVSILLEGRLETRKVGEFKIPIIIGSVVQLWGGEITYSDPELERLPVAKTAKHDPPPNPAPAPAQESEIDYDDIPF